MTRIRYKNNNGRLLSSTIVVGENEVQVELRPSELSYVIHTLGGESQVGSLSDEDVLSSNSSQTGNANNLSALKRKAKQVLRSMGANFGSESRVPRSGSKKESV